MSQTGLSFVLEDKPSENWKSRQVIRSKASPILALKASANNISLGAALVRRGPAGVDSSIR
jgi:hypothetical protein